MKIGEEVHFMDNNSPKSSTITGIITIEGEVDMNIDFLSSSKVKAEDGQKIVLYDLGVFKKYPKEKLFASKEDLMNNVFELNK